MAGKLEESIANGLSPAMDNLLAAVQRNSDGTVTLRFLECTEGGAALVSDRGFLISDYSGQPVTMDGTIKTFAVPTGARKIRIYNAGPSTETVLVALGTSQQDAEDALNFNTDHATTGYFVPPVADAGAAAVAEFGLADDATHVAICNALAGDTPLVYVSFGG